jgi:hypothetical protein
MDTFKDKQLLDDLYTRGNAPWEVWKRDANGRSQSARGTRRSPPVAGTNAHVRLARHARRSA